jgi:branched-chain amino acid transport system ATP-binding protein
LLEIIGINVCYGNIPAIFDVSLRAESNQTTSIVGGNGAGKTTLLKTISALIRPRKGIIRFKDENILGIPPYEIVSKGIVHIPEGRKIFPSLTVLENLELGSYHKKAKRRRPESLVKVFNLFPRLEERQKQVAGTLSGGEQQMLAIGRALMTNPRLILMDEPSEGLAPLIVKEVGKIIYQLKRKGFSILLVEQNLPMALKIADYLYILSNGEIVYESAPDQLRSNNEVKAKYIGVAG